MRKVIQNGQVLPAQIKITQSYFLKNNKVGKMLQSKDKEYI